jgi:polyhydroxyalkanoate synthase
MPQEPAQDASDEAHVRDLRRWRRGRRRQRGPRACPPQTPVAATRNGWRWFNDERAAMLDRATNAQLAALSGGLALPRLLLSYLDWAIYMSMSPGKQLQLAEDAINKVNRFCAYAFEAASGKDVPRLIEPESRDWRFADPGWRQWPFNVLSQGFLLQQEWWRRAMTGVRGMSERETHLVDFATRQLLDIFAPSNFPWTNPHVLRTTREEQGMNLMRGGIQFVKDMTMRAAGEYEDAADKSKVGRDVAVTPGKVVFRNRLIELIQYRPTTDAVQAEPILIVPAWIMKYYILDLSPHNSMVKYLVDNGFTVFTVSWKNPDAEDREISMDDYRELGVMAALDAVNAIVPERKVHALGYCVGGTLLSIAAADMARAGDDRLQTISLLAAQTDFTEAGELLLFINDAQLTYLDALMWKHGYLDASQMAGAFQLLRSNDLVWGRAVERYLLGKPFEPNDLMAWNADATRMPYRMHIEYLRRLYLKNELAEGHYHVKGHAVTLNEIRTPIFCVGTVKDHVAPWKSVYKILLLADNAEITFLLTSGGHNAGIVSEPGHARRHYQVSTWQPGEEFIDPEAWQADAPRSEGSWWPEWLDWLERHSSGLVDPPAMGAAERNYPPLGDAPGTYVYVK